MPRLVTLLAQFESGVFHCDRFGKLPRLLVLTDTARGFDLDRQRQRWPCGAALIERTYGAQPSKKDPKLHLPLQLGTCSPRQARLAKLDGLHWPEKRLNLRRVSATRGFIETTSAHSGLAIAKAARLNLDAILVSTAFASKSPSATKSLGAIRLAQLQRTFPNARLYALGGITDDTVKWLRRTGLFGVALVSHDID